MAPAPRPGCARPARCRSRAGARAPASRAARACVDDLVGAVRLALEEVGEPAPARRRKWPGRRRRRRRDRPRSRGGALDRGRRGNREDVAPWRGAARGRPLVLVALGADQVSVRVDAERLGSSPADDQLERGQVRAREERIEIGGRETGRFSAPAHVVTLTGSQRLQPAKPPALGARTPNDGG